MAYVRSKRYPELFKPEGSKVWWAFIPVSNGRRPRESTKQIDERLAHLWYLDRVKSDIVEAKAEITLGDALAGRRSERRVAGRAEGTLHCYKVKGAALERVLGREMPLSKITAKTVDAYISQRLRGDTEHDPVERATIYKELVALRGAMKLARRQGYACPAVDEVMPLDFSGQSKAKERALSEHEITLLLTALARYPKRQAIVAFLLATGATYPSELLQLRPKTDVQKDRWMVRLRGTKRQTRDRWVPIVPHARVWLEVAIPYLPFESWGNVRRDLHAACDAAGIPHCSPNDLRRSAASLLRAKGVEPHIIGVFLGHKDSRMAERVYGRVTPDQLAHLLEQRLG